MDGVWGRELFVTSRSVDRCIATLRAKIETDPARPELIVTVWGVGYKMNAVAGDRISA